MLQVWYQSLKDDKYMNIKINFLLTYHVLNMIGIEMTYSF